MSVASFLGDLSHLASFSIIVFWIERGESCVGFSGKMQVLQAAAYLTRYWDFVLFYSIYASIIRIISISLSLYIIYIIFWKYKKTYEKRCDSFWIESIILSSIALAFCLHIYDGTPTPDEVCWLFSRFVESVSIVPQIYFYLIKQQKDVAVTYYLMALSLYRGFYITDWIIAYLLLGSMDKLVFYPGILQICLYGVYFLLPKGKEETLPVFRNVPPKFMTQLSLLETPLLKRTCTASSSIYILGRDSSYSTLNRSISQDSHSTSSDNERY